MTGWCLSFSVVYCQDLSVKTVSQTTGDCYLPFVSADMQENGRSNGAVKSVFCYQGQAINIDTLPLTRRFKWCLEHNYPGTFLYVYSDERDQWLLYSKPINYILATSFVAQYSAIATSKGIQEKRLSLACGYTTSNIIGSLQERFKMIAYDTTDSTGYLKTHLKKLRFTCFYTHICYRDLLRKAQP